jgi:hypothetical protein
MRRERETEEESSQRRKGDAERKAFNRKSETEEESFQRRREDADRKATHQRV